MRVLALSSTDQPGLFHLGHLLTLAFASTWAPFCTRYRTTSVWPALAAMCSAVSPLCTQQQKHNRINNTLQGEQTPACFINTEIPATQLRMIATRKLCCTCCNIKSIFDLTLCAAKQLIAGSVSQLSSAFVTIFC